MVVIYIGPATIVNQIDVLRILLINVASLCFAHTADEVFPRAAIVCTTIIVFAYKGFAPFFISPSCTIL